MADTSARPQQDLPTGTVTFLYTDIEGSTKRWEAYPDVMKAAMERHDTIMRTAIKRHGGVVFRTMGDAFCASFLIATQALSATLDAQRSLMAETWDLEVAPIFVRMALHTGLGEVRDNDYVGTPLNRIARLMATGYGGQTLLSQATYELVRDALPQGVSLRDLGEHRLKDLLNSEHVYQVIAPDLPADFPPIKALDYRPNNLPAQPTAFVGRTKEVAEVRAILKREDPATTGAASRGAASSAPTGQTVRLVTLLGPGGTGKTRLALEVGVELLDGYMDGVFFVSLSAIDDASLVTSQIAQALGVRETGGLPLIESVKDYLRDKRLLLLLDNFEQVVEAAPVVAELLASAPQLNVLVTSQQALRLRGEQIYPVPPLGLPDPEVSLSIAELAQYEAVALFMQRAQLANPSFDLTTENASAVAEICYRLDGLPLAIELAAARTRLLPPEAMLGRLDSSLKLLTGGARDLPTRQQTLRGAIEWSYNLLEDGEKQLFMRLAVFVGGCTLEEAEAVCGGGVGNQESGVGNLSTDSQLLIPDSRFPTPLEIDVFDGIESLADKSLLRQEGGANSEPRFRMLQTIREYGLERLAESGEGDVVRGAHAEFYLKLVEEAEPNLSGPQQAEWMDRLDTEHGNIRAALEWFMIAPGETAAQRTEMGLRMAGALLWFWQTRGHLSEGRERLSMLLSRPAEGRTMARAKALLVAGRLAFLQGDYEMSRAFFEENVQIWRELGDKRGIGHALIALGSVVAAQGDYATARSLYEEGLAIERELGDRSYTAMALVGMGEAILNEGDYGRATPMLNESLSLFRELGNKAGAAFSLSLLGRAAHHEGDYTRSKTLLDESLSLRSELENKQGVALCLIGLSEIVCSEGKLERASTLLGAAQSLLGAAGARISPADQARYERCMTAAREGLNSEAWDEAWQRGRAMSIEQAREFGFEGG